MTEGKGTNTITDGRMNGNLLHKQEAMVNGINRRLISILKDTFNIVCYSKMQYSKTELQPSLIMLVSYWMVCL